MAKFCTDCGEKLTLRGSFYLKGRKICGECLEKIQKAEPAYIVNGLSCPKCGTLTERGARPGWQILLSIIFFPLGLLSLLAGRNPTECHKCNFRWMA